jgi:hypothetical protein
MRLAVQSSDLCISSRHLLGGPPFLVFELNFRAIAIVDEDWRVCGHHIDRVSLLWRPGSCHDADHVGT